MSLSGASSLQYTAARKGNVGRRTVISCHILHLDPSPLFVDLAMSKTTPTALSSFSPKLHRTFEASLNEYEKKTEISLLTHPLVVQLQDCNSPSDILVVLRSQVARSAQTTAAEENLIRWLDPIVNVLSASSPVISTCIGLVNPIQILFLQFNLNRVSSYSHPQISFSLVPVFSFRKLSSWISLARSNLISNPYRPQRTLL